MSSIAHLTSMDSSDPKAKIKGHLLTMTLIYYNTCISMLFIKVASLSNMIYLRLIVLKIYILFIFFPIYMHRDVNLAFMLKGQRLT